MLAALPCSSLQPLNAYHAGPSDAQEGELFDPHSSNSAVDTSQRYSQQERVMGLVWMVRRSIFQPMWNATGKSQ